MSHLNPVKPPLGLQGVDMGNSFFDEHIWELDAAVKSLVTLEAYVRPLSGNPSYRFPRNYEAARDQYNELIDGATAPDRQQERARSAPVPKTPTANNPAPPQPAEKNGCYIATAVYGSYDAPEVVLLRQFRDQNLATSPAGRAFIRVYYAVSPTFARFLKPATTLNRVVRRLLDRFVVGVERMSLDWRQRPE